MRQSKRKRLERAGLKVGDLVDFLGLSDTELAIIDMRVALALELRKRRLQEELSQTALADRIGSSQSRVAKMEAGDRSVSIDLLVRSLLALGLTIAQVGRVIARAEQLSSNRTSALNAPHFREAGRAFAV